MESFGTLVRPTILTHDERLRSYMLAIYQRLGGGLLLTAFTSWIVTLPSIAPIFYHEVMSEKTHKMVMSPTLLGLAAMLIPFGLILWMRKIGGAAAFWGIAGFMGVMVSPMLAAYTGMSIAVVFALTALMFGALSLVGYTTKANLGTMGTFLFIALLGLIGANLASIFIPMPRLLIDCVGVLVFSGFIAVDTQKMKMDYYTGDETDSDAIYSAALNLYLDLINLMIYLLEIFGIKKDR